MKHRRNRHRHESITDRRLYRDPSRGRLGGVCAGLADYFNVDTWLVRIVAVTALLFLFQVTFIAYLVAWAVLPRRDEVEEERRDGNDRDPLRDEYARQAAFDDRLREEDGNELDRRRRAFRSCRESMDRIDQRIRKLESYVTSKRFELNRQFRDLGR
jgi:phage shock protein C